MNQNIYRFLALKNKNDFGCVLVNNESKFDTIIKYDAKNSFLNISINIFILKIM